MSLRKKYYYLTCCLTFLFLSPHTYSETLADSTLQSNSYVLKQTKFDKTKWKKITTGMDFSKEKLKNSQNYNFSFPSLNGTVAMFILFTIIIVFLGFLLFKLFKVKTIKNAKINAANFKVDDPEDIQESDLEAFLNEALKNNAFRLAIRIYYLMILKELSANDMIIWKKDKTNSEYIYEMNKQSYFKEFQLITVVFERVWYGDSDLGQDEFHSLSPMFKNIIEGISNKK